ncbi:MAG: DUF6438 domain-containing protein [Bacteroidetes bacterium]|nr:DUF6438 domain-containing protein [Bacteroidota bacterium]
MKALRILLSILLISANTFAVNLPKKAKPMFAMERTRCFGACPAYTIEIYKNGLVKYHGIADVKKMGNYTKKLKCKEVNALKKEFKAAKFFEFKDEYTAHVTDLPTTYISFNYHGKSKKIKDYWEAPLELEHLENLLDIIANSEVGWTKDATETK